MSTYDYRLVSDDARAELDRIAAGFTVALSVDEMRPMVLRVLASPR